MNSNVCVARVLSLEEQQSRILQDYNEGLDMVSPEEVENWNISRHGITPCWYLRPAILSLSSEQSCISCITTPDGRWDHHALNTMSLLLGCFHLPCTSQSAVHRTTPSSAQVHFTAYATHQVSMLASALSKRRSVLTFTTTQSVNLHTPLTT